MNNKYLGELWFETQRIFNEGKAVLSSIKLHKINGKFFLYTSYLSSGTAYKCIMKCESGRVQYVFFNESKDIALCEVLRHNEIFKKINFTKSTSKIVDTSVEKESFDNVYNEILNDNI